MTNIVVASKFATCNTFYFLTLYTFCNCCFAVNINTPNKQHSVREGLVSLGRLPIWERGTPIINPQTGEARQAWLATHLEEESSDF